METHRLQARRWPYALLAFAFALVALFFVEVLPHGRRGDPSFYVINGGFLLASSYMAVSLTLKSILVPQIAMQPEGLSLRVGLRRRFLKWSQISDVALRRTQRGSFAAVHWQRVEGGPMKGLWLNYPFPVEGTAVVDQLERCLAAARTKGASRPAVLRTFSDEAVRVARVLRLLKWSSVAAAAAFVGWVYDINAATTELVTPVPSTILRAIQIVGVSLMAGPVVLVVLLARMQRARPTPTAALVLAAALLGATAFAFGMVIADDAAKRTAEASAFHDSTAPFSPRYFRITNFGRNKGGSYAVIEPYPPTDSRLPVSDDDYARLRAADRPNEASVYCYPVTAQEAEGAVRIRTPEMRSGQAPTIVPCPSRTDDRWR